MPAAPDPLLEAVDLHGAHDFRHTYVTWLEDAGIPARVIDELMGHEATGRSTQHQGSAMGDRRLGRRWQHANELEAAGVYPMPGGDGLADARTLRPDPRRVGWSSPRAARPARA